MSHTQCSTRKHIRNSRIALEMFWTFVHSGRAMTRMEKPSSHFASRLSPCSQQTITTLVHLLPGPGYKPIIILLPTMRKRQSRLGCKPSPLLGLQGRTGWFSRQCAQLPDTRNNQGGGTRTNGLCVKALGWEG